MQPLNRCLIARCQFGGGGYRRITHTISLMHAHTHRHTHTHTHMSTHAHTCRHTYKACTQTSTNTHSTRTYSHTHTYTHIQTHMRAQAPRIPGWEHHHQLHWKVLQRLVWLWGPPIRELLQAAGVPGQHGVLVCACVCVCVCVCVWESSANPRAPPSCWCTWPAWCVSVCCVWGCVCVCESSANSRAPPSWLVYLAKMACVCVCVCEYACHKEKMFLLHLIARVNILRTFNCTHKHSRTHTCTHRMDTHTFARSHMYMACMYTCTCRWWMGLGHTHTLARSHMYMACMYTCTCRWWMGPATRAPTTASCPLTSHPLP